MNEAESTPDTSEHPEMDRASAEVAALTGDVLSALAPDTSVSDAVAEAFGDSALPLVAIDAATGHAQLVGEMTSDQVARSMADNVILFAALCRLSRLMGGPMVGEHTGDIDTTGLSPEFTSVVDWAKTARIA